MTMRYLIFIFFLINQVEAQVTSGDIGERSMIIMTPEAASTIEFWGKKGVSSVPYISALETKMQILETKLDFQEMLNSNCRSAQEEYRRMVQNAADRNFQLQKDLSDAVNERDKWKLKARNRSQMMGLGAVIIGLMAYIQITN